MRRRFFVFILTLFLMFINTYAESAPNYVQKEIKVSAQDGFNIEGILIYPKVKSQKEFSTIILLH